MCLQVGYVEFTPLRSYSAHIVVYELKENTGTDFLILHLSGIKPMVSVLLNQLPYLLSYRIIYSTPTQTQPADLTKVLEKSTRKAAKKVG